MKKSIDTQIVALKTCQGPKTELIEQLKNDIDELEKNIKLSHVETDKNGYCTRSNL